MRPQFCLDTFFVLSFVRPSPCKEDRYVVKLSIGIPIRNSSVRNRIAFIHISVFLSIRIRNQRLRHGGLMLSIGTAGRMQPPEKGMTCPRVPAKV